MIFFICAIFFGEAAAAQTETNLDVIAFRIVENPAHYSAKLWYKQKGFTGSPQSLTVGGYDAVRDGRTVYINASNIGDDNKLYTNIYIISYNQTADPATVDIFSRILANWKFNNNLPNTGQCFSDSGLSCIYDKDCPVDDYCTGVKAQVIRDTRRLADIAEISIALDDYQVANSRYHTLRSGTYIPGQSLSVWPSWNDVFSRDLGISLPKDPLNKIGDCGDPRFNIQTCWDESAREFSGSIPDILPSGSRVYAYSSADDGSSFRLCAVMESIYGQAMGASSCTTASAPVKSFSITGISLPAIYSGSSFNGYVEVDSDSPGELVWTLTPVSNFAGWSGVPVLSETNDPSQMRISAASAGAPGTYTMLLTITDGNTTISQDISITVNAGGNPYILQIPDFTVAPGGSVGFLIRGIDPDGNYPLSFNVSGLPQTLIGQLVNGRNWQVSGTITSPAGSYQTTAIATDSTGISSAPMNFTITVANSAPIFTSMPATQSMPGATYVYSIRVVDPDGHSVTVSASGLPPGFNFDPISMVISGTSPTAGSYNISISATDQYGASSNQNFTLQIGTEAFTISAIPGGTVYVCPGGVCPPVSNVYHTPVTFTADADVSTGNTVTYSLSKNPAWLSINPVTGEIQGTPINQVGDVGSFSVMVSAIDANGVKASTEFTLTVLPNAWCGDYICDASRETEASCLVDCSTVLAANIISPSDGATVNATDCIIFRGAATGGIPPYTYSWTSDIDGYLGTGADLRFPPGCIP